MGTWCPIRNAKYEKDHFENVKSIAKVLDAAKHVAESVEPVTLFYRRQSRWSTIDNFHYPP